MSEILELHWNRELEERLVEWLVQFGQLTPVAAADLSTPENISRGLMRRLAEARQAVKRLKSVMGGHTVAVLDLDVVGAVEKLKVAAGAETDTLREYGNDKTQTALGGEALGGETARVARETRTEPPAGRPAAGMLPEDGGVLGAR